MIDTLANPVPLTIIAAAVTLIISILVGAFWQALQLVQGAFVYVFAVPLVTMMSVNTLAASQVFAYTYWNCVSFGVLYLIAMFIISTGVNGGVSSAPPKRPPGKSVDIDPEQFKEAQNAEDTK